MSRIWMPGSMGGGADLELVTAEAGDILKGAVIVDKDGNPLTGTLELTGSAADSQVLSGQTYYNTNAKTKRTGSMANQGAKTAALNCGGSYTIPAGYHNGAGKITANSLASQTDATAAAGDVLSGKTAFVRGNKITGSMANRSALNWSGINTTYNVPAGYYSGGSLDSRPSYNNGYNAGVTAADNRANTNSTNYKTGYNAGYSAGVTAADNRTNTNSANYKAGYNAGVAAGKNTALTGVSGSFTSGASGTTTTINTGFSTISAVVMICTDFSTGATSQGFVAYTNKLGGAGMRGGSMKYPLSISGGTITYNALDSNWANRGWTYHVFGQ